MTENKKSFFFITLMISHLLIILWCTSLALSYPVQFIDADGNNICIEKRPSQVVSLVPSVTEIIFRIGAGDSVGAITYHSTYPPETAHKEIIGGFFSPSIKAMETINPDVIFLSGHHRMVRKRLNNGRCRLINLEADSISDAYENILLLGKIFHKEDEAAGIADDIRNRLQTIALKIARIPHVERKRVIRLMGRESVMTPGDDSFQNEFIRLAGGIPPELNKKGHIVPVSKEEWMRFNPQVIYGCGGDRETAKKFFNRPGWKDVDAVRNGKIFYFPCDLTCRASTKSGYFVSWLSSMIYQNAFSRKEDQVLEDQVLDSHNIDIDLNYIKDARIVYSNIYDFMNKSLIINFNNPLSVVSTLEGQRQGIESVGNHYSPPPCWVIGHKEGLKGIKSQVYEIVGKSEDTASFLFTGADIDNLSIKCERFKEMEVYALVTAGVKSNAVRMSQDEGRFYELGTINIILLSNMRLTPRAMTRAIISATEAKTAALLDMDVRSSYTPLIHQATGTGTDNIIVVEGRGKRIDNAGGHTKMGEIIARAVYGAVQEAIYKQNGMIAKRNIFQRLQERKISVFGLVSLDECGCDIDENDLVMALEEILLQKRYASFITSSFAISDDYETGLINDLYTFEICCKKIAEGIAGKEIRNMNNLVAPDNIPVVMKMALNAILNGLFVKMKVK